MLSAKRVLIAAGLTTFTLLPLAAAGADEQEKLQERLQRLEDKLEGSGISAVVRDLERIKQENRELRGEIEQLNHQLKRLEQRQHSLYKDLDNRLVEARQDRPADGRQETDHYTALSALQKDLEADKNAQGEQPKGEEEMYQEAFRLLSDGMFNQAREGFSQVLQHYPEGRYASNALYWIAETYYAEDNFAQATNYFKKVLEEHPNSNKAPDALLKLGYIAFEEDKLEESTAKLEKVKEQHPQTTAAELAQQRLSDIRRLRSKE